MSDIAYTDDGVPYDPNVGYNPLYPQTKKDDTPQYALPVEAPNFEQPSIEQKMQAIQIRIPQKKEPTLKPVDHNPFEFEQTPAPQGTNIIDKLAGTNGVERYQTWPEKIVREGLDAPHKALTTGFVPGSNEEIAGAQAIAGI
jgi:hypothetical protein